MRTQTKQLYDETKRVYTTHNGEDESLPELIISNNFDDEQIWQQLELQNSQFLDSIAHDIGDLATSNTKVARLKTKRVEVQEDQSSDEDVDIEGDSDSSVQLSDDDDYDDFIKRAHANTSSLGPGVSTDDQGLPVFDGGDDADDDDISDEDDRAMKQLLDKCEAEEGRDEDDGSEMSLSEEDNNG